MAHKTRMPGFLRAITHDTQHFEYAHIWVYLYIAFIAMYCPDTMQK